MSKRTRMERATLCVADPSGSTIPERPPALASPALCRYKTGRCMNPRVIKPNGTLLLLCEYHRCQQNRTKKRSDMKYRQHRAAKRQLERAAQPHVSSMTQELVTASDDSVDCPTASPSCQNIRFVSNSTTRRGIKRRNGTSDWLPPADMDYAYPRTSSFATSPPPAVVCSSFRPKAEFCDTLSMTETAATETMTSASPTTAADFESATSPWPSVWADVLLPPESPPQLSPLASSPGSPVAWEPEELELLEYFIMS